MSIKKKIEARIETASKVKVSAKVVNRIAMTFEREMRKMGYYTDSEILDPDRGEDAEILSLGFTPIYKTLSLYSVLALDSRKESGLQSVINDILSMHGFSKNPKSERTHYLYSNKKDDKLFIRISRFHIDIIKYK